MNAENAVSTRCKCSNCGNIANVKPLSRCEKKVTDSEGNSVTCNGIYNMTNGQHFKNTHGYSKTLKRNMKKHGLNPMEFSDSLKAYKEIRKKRKQKQAVVRKDKHSTAKANRGSKSNKKK